MGKQTVSKDFAGKTPKCLNKKHNKIGTTKQKLNKTHCLYKKTLNITQISFTGK